MPLENAESFKLDLDRVDAYLNQTPALIERAKARTANLVSVLLVCGLVGSLPLYITALLAKPDSAQMLASVFEKWYSVVSPLAGAAIGAYFATRVEPDQRKRRR
jgi:hypothetical protein